MQYIHDNKPPVPSGNTSLFVDLVFWHPREPDTKALILFLQTYHLGERSQTVEWMHKFTVRLSTWKGRYFYFLTPEQWQEAAADIIQFIEAVDGVYHCKKIEYDTRAFSVGLAQKVRHEAKPVSAIVDAEPVKNHPVWWTLKTSASRSGVH